MLLAATSEGGFSLKIVVLALFFGSLLVCSSVAILRLYHGDNWRASSRRGSAPPLLAADAFTCPSKSKGSSGSESAGRSFSPPSVLTPPRAFGLQSGATGPLKPVPSEPPAAAASPAAELDGFFCRDLVVPPSCECILKVPLQPVSHGPFDVTDLDGNMVLHVEPRPMPGRVATAACAGNREPDESLAPPNCRLVLLTGFGNVLAQCGPAPGRATSPAQTDGPQNLAPARASTEFHLLKGSGELFGKLTRTDAEEQQYTLTDRHGACLHFWGDIGTHIHVCGESRKLVACTEIVPESMVDGRASCYKVQVAPLMDVGLILCGLLCLDRLS